MKRKVIQIAESTQLVSLPRKWAQKYNIKKGDEIEVEEDGDRIIISKESHISLETAELNVKDWGKFLPRVLFALDKKGVDEIKINLTSPEDLIKIQNILKEDVIIYEIIEQNKSFCVIKSFKGSIENFDLILKRIILLLISMSEDGVISIKENDINRLRSLISLEDTNDRFTSLCRRYLNKEANSKLDFIGPIYFIVEVLEKIADEYKHLFEKLTQLKEIKIRKEIMNFFEKLPMILRAFYDIFYKNDKEKYIFIENSRNEIKELWNKILPKLKNQTDILVMYYTKNIMKHIFNLVGPTLIINLPIQKKINLNIF